MLELALPILVGAAAAVAMLGLVRKSRAMAESDNGRSLAAVVVSRSAGLAARSAGWVRATAASRLRGYRTLRPSRPPRPSRQRRAGVAKPGEEPKPLPSWVKVAGPQVWREGKDIGCEQCQPSWELGMKTCVRCGRRLADVFTASGR